jgi:enediyne biosynthesis protein E4
LERPITGAAGGGLRNKQKTRITSKYMKQINRLFPSLKPKILLTLGVFLTALISSSAQTNFVKITTGSIVTDKGTYIYGTWGDFNNNGYLDLFIANDYGVNAFYLNNGNGTFTSDTNSAPVQDNNDDHIGAAAGDYDNDGNLDLAVSGGIAVPAGIPTVLYHGNGDGTFSVTGGVVTNQLGHFGPCVWADYDHDGFLDLFVADHGYYGAGARNRLYRNNGDGTFTEVTAGAIVTDIGDGFDCLWADYDNDGFDDLLVCNLGPSANAATTATNFLYHNNGDGTFTRVTNAAVHIGSDNWSDGSPGGAWGDYDNDGFQDFFAAGNDGTSDRLYHNNGDGTFSVASTIARPGGTASLGGAWGDYDNDGYLDLLVRTDGGHNRVYHNNGNGTFTAVTQGPIVTENLTGFSCWTADWVDYDNDGFLDLFVARSADSGATASNLLYHNTGNSNGWLEVKLVGTASNRSGIGAKVRLHATIGGNAFWQMREIRDGGAGGPSLVAHFGLGDATNVDTLRIEWPSVPGTVQELTNIVPRQILTITEPPRLMGSIVNGTPQFSMKGGRGFQYEIDSSPDLSTWSSNSVITITNLNGTAQIIDTNAPTEDRFYRLKQLP